MDEAQIRLLEESRREILENERELNLKRIQLEIALDLLAWRLVVELPAGRGTRFPSAALVWNDWLLSWLALRDCHFSTRARVEVLEYIRGGLKPNNEEIIALIERLLTQEPLATRRAGGDHVARDMLILVVISIAAVYSDWDQNSACFDVGANVSGLSSRLCDALNQHALLKGFPDAVPSESTVRAVWNKRKEFLRAVGLAEHDLFDAFAESAFPG